MTKRKAIKIEANGTPAFQGDVMFRSIPALPPGVVEQKKPTKAGTIVAHSETGHHHIATGAHRLFTLPDDPMRTFIVAKGPIVVTHHRSTDTHETFELYSEVPEVVWEIGRQREYVPEGWRRVED